MVCSGLLWGANGGCAGGECPTGEEVMQPCTPASLLDAESEDGA